MAEKGERLRHSSRLLFVGLFCNLRYEKSKVELRIERKKMRNWKQTSGINKFSRAFRSLFPLIWEYYLLCKDAHCQLYVDFWILFLFSPIMPLKIQFFSPLWFVVVEKKNGSLMLNFRSGIQFKLQPSTSTFYFKVLYKNVYGNWKTSLSNSLNLLKALLFPFSSIFLFNYTQNNNKKKRLFILKAT